MKYTGVKSFVDTNIFVYCRDFSDLSKQKIALQLVKELWESELGVISVQVVTEFCSVASRKLKAPDLQVQKDAQRLLTWNPVPLDEKLIRAGIRLRQQYKLSYSDSWIVAAALQSGCQILFSEDLADGANYHGVLVKNPFL